jgi:hypothetical protein
MTTDRVVELCSAANDIEAHALCAVLNEAGIRARVAGVVLENAVGMLPLGESTAPRIWVLASEAARARETLDEWLQQDGSGTEEESETSEPADTLEQPPEGQAEEQEPTTLDAAAAHASRVTGVLGLVCLLIGVVWAWRNWEQVRTYSRTAEGIFWNDTISGFESQRSVFADLPISGQRGTTVRPKFDTLFVYRVDGVYYWLTLRDTGLPPSSVVVCYDPRNPGRAVLGPLVPPWYPLLFGVAIGAFLWFVAYKFR